MEVSILTTTFSVSSAFCHLPVFEHPTMVRNGLKNTSVANSLKLNVSHIASENTISDRKRKYFFLLFYYYCPHSLTVDSLKFKRLFHADMHRMHIGNIKNWGWEVHMASWKVAS